MIRNLGEKDFEEYYRVRLEALEKYPVAYSSMSKFFRECSKVKHLKLLKDSSSESSRFFLKGYFEQGRLLGMIGMLPETRESVDHKATLWGFYVDQEYQGKGIGQKLIDEFLVSAKTDSQLRSIRLMAAVSCQKAISLFKKVGFEEYGRERDSIRDENNNFYDQIYMQISCV